MRLSLISLALPLLVLACADKQPMSMSSTGSESSTGDGDGDASDTGTSTGDGDGMPDTGFGHDSGVCMWSQGYDDCPIDYGSMSTLLPLACPATSPCSALVLTYPFGAGEPSFDAATHACMAAALRDGTTGRYVVDSQYSDWGHFSMFDVLPNRMVQRAYYAPDDTGGCSLRWETRPLLDPSYYQGCLDQSDLTLAAACIEDMWDSSFTCVPLDELSC